MNQFKITFLFLLLVSVSFARYSIKDLTNSQYLQAKRRTKNTVKAQGFGPNFKYPCSEPDDVHETWVEARNQARLIGATGREVAEMTLEAIQGYGLSGQQYACLAFEISVSENIEQCASILFSREIGQRQGVEYDVATEWTENIVKRIYPWYRGYRVTCAKEAMK